MFPFSCLLWLPRPGALRAVPVRFAALREGALPSARGGHRVTGGAGATVPTPRAEQQQQTGLRAASPALQRKQRRVYGEVCECVSGLRPEESGCRTRHHAVETEQLRETAPDVLWRRSLRGPLQGTAALGGVRSEGRAPVRCACVSLVPSAGVRGQHCGDSPREDARTCCSASSPRGVACIPFA